MFRSSYNQTHPYSSSTKLFNLNCSAEVLCMDYNENCEINFLRYGELDGKFGVNLIIQSMSPLMMVTCTVYGLQWPISKDAPIIRVGQRRFAFGIPGLVYGLQFPSSCEEENMNTLERIFMKFGHYHDLTVRKSTGYRLKEDDPKFWQKILPRIEIIAHNTLSKFGHHPGRSPSAVDNQDMGIERVHQTSDIIKMVSDAILSGSLKFNHIELQDMRSEKKCGANSGSSAIISEQVFASVSVFTDLVEAIELEQVIASGKSHLLKGKFAGLIELVGFKMWRLNQLGIAAFMKKLQDEK
ncbi:hypothetical protein Ddye_001602 [Dipteronia dyeriana]|uniref:Uncharacterized protein n=1 Tax=Dipteronia dyeriana TaxID=168575 RepID=A0AAE0CU53_9ROSI|nr:hypothetical protein Ddye_001602 [Dipteronia dyeriana]